MASIPLLPKTEAPSDQTNDLLEPKDSPLIKKHSRRAHIDVIRVGLTWGILLFHTVLIYVPTKHSFIKDPFVQSLNLKKTTFGEIVS